MTRLLAIVLLFAAAPAFADDLDGRSSAAAPPDRPGKAAAERYFRAGAKAYSAQSFAAAAADFDEAYKAMPLPEIAFSAAQAYRRLYRVDPKPEYVRRSVELYRIYLDHVKSGGRVGDAADSLGEMERELEHVKIRVEAAAPAVAHTRLGVSVTIAGESSAGLREIGDAPIDLSHATAGLVATLDGKPVEPFALVDVDPHEHVFAVTAEGYLPVEKKALAVTGQSQLIEVELKPKPATLHVATEPGARIAVDGRAVDAQGAFEIAPGKHLLTITHRGREPFGRELALTHGQALTVTAPLAMTSRRKAVPWLVGGASVLGAGAIATGIVALVRDSRASDLRAQHDAGNQPVSTADAYDRTVASRDHFVTATWLLGGAAVAAGATGVLLYLFDEPSAEGIHVVPVAGAGGAGALVSGRF